MLASLLMTDGVGRDAHVVSLLPGGELRDRLAEAGIPVYDLGMRRGGITVAGIWRLAQIIRRVRPAVVQSWMYHADLVSLLALILSGRRGSTTLVWGIRCSDMDTSKYGRALKTVIRTCVLLSRLPDAVVANSQAGADVHRGLGYRPRTLEVVWNGIDSKRFCPDPEARAAVREELGIAPDRVVLAHVARVDPMKDHASFLAALERLPGVTALTIGTGTESLPERPNLLRLGRRDDVSRLLAASDIIVSSSAFGEGFSNAIAEGMAADLPAVATDVGDARVIVGRAGRIVPPGDPAALAEAVAELVALGPGGRAQLGARTRIATTFPLSRAADEFAALYQRLGADKRTAANQAVEA